MIDNDIKMNAKWCTLSQVFIKSKQKVNLQN